MPLVDSMIYLKNASSPQEYDQNIFRLCTRNVRKVEKEGSRMKGKASILIDDVFAVHDIRIIEGDNGLFIAMPSRKTSVGGYRDIAHPISPEVRAMFEEAIFEDYNKVESEEE